MNLVKVSKIVHLTDCMLMSIAGTCMVIKCLGKGIECCASEFRLIPSCKGLGGNSVQDKATPYLLSAGLWSLWWQLLPATAREQALSTSGHLSEVLFFRSGLFT